MVGSGVVETGKLSMPPGGGENHVPADANSGVVFGLQIPVVSEMQKTTEPSDVVVNRSGNKLPLDDKGEKSSTDDIAIGIR